MLALVALLGAGCTSGQASTSKQGPKPAGATPSPIAVQVCAREARNDIASALGEKATVSRPTWVDHLYQCRYGYPTGSFVLSVKELSSW
ncbi:MAG TPA: hypothetical protein VHW93_05100, partial [Acidimicrobiales bacterium]|nr:hypothetical protein [Acidimicrobiales bacterium]